MDKGDTKLWKYTHVFSISLPLAEGFISLYVVISHIDGLSIEIWVVRYWLLIWLIVCGHGNTLMILAFPYL